MRVRSVTARSEQLALTRPYTIAFRTISGVELAVVEIAGDNGALARGSASPEPYVTGESVESCRAALSGNALDWLVGEDVRALPRLVRELGRRFPDAPAARAALDIALHDLYAQDLGLPLVEILGRAHERLPTSITIGIKTAAETVAEAEEYRARGFGILKVKLGHSVDEDIERLVALRDRFGGELGIRVDANQGYSCSEVVRFAEATAALDIELIEQPVSVAATDELRMLPEAIRRRIAADESLLTPADALALAASPAPCGIFNIKLMKSGGIGEALRIASIAEAAGIELMWGCNDESRISIAAALHAALASPATRYLDLDGSLDLAEDFATGGFVLEDGCLSVTDRPGLGLTGP